MFWGMSVVTSLMALLYFPWELGTISLVQEVVFFDRIMNYYPLVYCIFMALLFGALLVISSVRAIRYICWFVGNPEYVFYEEGMSCITAFSRHPRVYSWDALTQVTSIHAHFVFQQGKRVILPAEFWNHCYKSAECADLLDKKIGKKLSTKVLGFYIGKSRYFK